MEPREKASEWTRCSEGFTDFKNSEKESKPGHTRSRKKKSCDAFKYRASQSASLEDEIKDTDILWSSSDSEDNTVCEVHLSKRKKTAKRPSPSKRKPVQVLHFPSSSETVDIVTSESESEIVTQVSAVNSGSVKEGSIMGYESASDEEQNHAVTVDHNTPTVKDVYETDSPRISGSTQSLSPPTTSTGSGVKASDWAKSLQFKTPSKSEYQGEMTTADDSAKKKKKHSRGGLADQLSRLQARERSSLRMWSHQQNKSASSSQDPSKTVNLRVLGFDVLYSMQIVKCAVLVGGEEREQKLVMFPVSESEQLNLQVGTEVTVYPPWQQLEMNDGQVIMLCTRFCQVSFQPEDIERENCGLSEKRKNTVSASWNCPCVQGLCKSQSQCPAFKFPTVPGLLVPKTGSFDSAPENVRITSPEKHLHTVAERVKEVKNISDSLLESIERSSEHVDNLDRGYTTVNFRGTVHRVNSSKADSRFLLLVEDGHGAVCEIQISNKTLEDVGVRPDLMEGKSYQFTGFHVHCRKTRDKDPSLFSLIDSVWSGTRGAVSSQDSESGTQNNNYCLKPLPIEAPSFCYVLTSDENDNISIKPCTVDVVHSKPVMFEQLAALKTEMNNTRRCSCIGRVLYVHHSLHDGSSPSEPLLYLTDPSLQKEEQPYIKCHIDRYSHKNPPVLDGYQGHHLQIKDALTDKGNLMGDTYTKLSSLSAEDENSQGTLKGDVNLPVVTDTVKKLDLCSIAGIISEVDEDSAYSWEACNYCNSDQLVSQTTESGDNAGSVKCKNCQKIVTNPDTKMKMEILVKSDHLPVVRVDLLQSTIERLLPGNEGDEEGYELSYVLNKPVGPLNCIVTDTPETSENKQLTLREIELLL